MIISYFYLLNLATLALMMLSGHTLEMTVFCSSTPPFQIIAKRFHLVVYFRGRSEEEGLWGRAPSEHNHVGTQAFPLKHHWSAGAAGKTQAGQASFHGAHMSNLELSKMCCSGAILWEDDLGKCYKQHPLGESRGTDGCWLSGTEMWSASFKTAVGAPACGMDDQKCSPFPGSLQRLFQGTLKPCLLFLFIRRGLRMQLSQQYSVASTELVWSINP